MKNIDTKNITNMPYDDIAYEILMKENCKMQLQTLFKKVGEMANLDPAKYDDKIVDFFELLSTDKRFIMLENGYWDLREHHSHKIKIDEDDNSILDEDTNDDEVDEINEEESDNEEYFDENEIEDDDSEEDLKELVILDEDEIDNDIA